MNYIALYRVTKEKVYNQVFPPILIDLLYSYSLPMFTKLFLGNRIRTIAPNTKSACCLLLSQKSLEGLK